MKSVLILVDAKNQLNAKDKASATGPSTSTKAGSIKPPSSATTPSG